MILEVRNIRGSGRLLPRVPAPHDEKRGSCELLSCHVLRSPITMSDRPRSVAGQQQTDNMRPSVRRSSDSSPAAAASSSSYALGFRTTLIRDVAQCSLPQAENMCRSPLLNVVARRLPEIAAHLRAAHKP